eukprot:TRINITY_DN44350_c0_g1_i1.p1 TRINITY_DN44350_c0_g1~~TRINITY_DN44350_c0_g1_i1.p1  ORF type:complete len:216 (+),score=33.67 TRINITY_DN44350_c0_g1_i1:216-863(+)
MARSRPAPSSLASPTTKAANLNLAGQRASLHRLCESCAAMFHRRWEVLRQARRALECADGPDKIRIASELASAEDELRHSSFGVGPTRTAMADMDECQLEAVTAAKSSEFEVLTSQIFRLKAVARGRRVESPAATHAWLESLSQSPERAGERSLSEPPPTPPGKPTSVSAAVSLLDCTDEMVEQLRPALVQEIRASLEQVLSSPVNHLPLVPSEL